MCRTYIGVYYYVQLQNLFPFLSTKNHTIIHATKLSSLIHYYTSWFRVTEFQQSNEEVTIISPTFFPNHEKEFSGWIANKLAFSSTNDVFECNQVLAKKPGSYVVFKLPHSSNPQQAFTPYLQFTSVQLHYLT